MKKILVFILLISSQVFATELNLEKYDQGERLYLSPGKGGCVNCHGGKGETPSFHLYPKLSGQNYTYLKNQLNDFKDKKRKNGLFIPMEVATEKLNTSEIESIAYYLSQQ